MDLGIRGRAALVLGASKGLGAAVSRSLAAEGARVMAVARDREALHKLVAELPGGGSLHGFVCLDLMEEGAVDRLMLELEMVSLTPEIIVHNLGGSLGVTDPISPMEAYQRVWRLNLGIALDINHLLIPRMRQARWGRIVHVSSASAKTFHGYAPYVAAKCALTGYIKSACRPLAPDNVILSAVAPGAIYAEGRYLSELSKKAPSELAEYFKHHLAASRLSQPEEVSSAVCFLCSNLASLASGTLMEFDGGSM
jgi:NAD(P)-dependent dehydrogenase (short-subunit alcohol dehydrogenase family)